jgi:RNA ligase
VLPLIHDLMDPADLVIAIDDGLVRAKTHPTLPLTIYNYAEKAVYTRTWTDVTRQCRGLVVDHDGVVRARPWPKFFNLGEHTGPLDPDARVQVTDKADGSLGILVHDQGEPLIATRGSFTSDQALHATELYRQRYADQWRPRWWITYLFEIVYPANRIVLDYNGLDDLILLGAVDTLTGETLGPDDQWLADWPGPRTPVYHYRSLGEALAAAPRPNAEGLVVRYPDIDLLVKIKQEDYVALHRIVTGLNARVVWEAVGNGTLEQLLEALPDEFQQWALDHARTLEATADAIEREATAEFGRIVNVLASKGIDRAATEYRREFADRAKHLAHAPLLFQLLDGKGIRPTIHKTLRPVGDVAPRTFTEEAA